MAYATIEDIKARTPIDFDATICKSLLEDASIIIDSYNQDADEEVKKIVLCRMVVRALPNEEQVPIGANQGTVSALGYSQTFTINGGTVGELYLNKLDKKLLGCEAYIGSHSPLEAQCR